MLEPDLFPGRKKTSRPRSSLRKGLGTQAPLLSFLLFSPSPLMPLLFLSFLPLISLSSLPHPGPNSLLSLSLSLSLSSLSLSLSRFSLFFSPLSLPSLSFSLSLRLLSPPLSYAGSQDEVGSTRQTPTLAYLLSPLLELRLAPSRESTKSSQSVSPYYV